MQIGKDHPIDFPQRIWMLPILTDAFTPYLDRWQLLPIGAPLQTPRASLLPVRRLNGLNAMLRVSSDGQDHAGLDLLSAWNGEGSAAIYERDGHSVLMALAQNPLKLTQMAQSGLDRQATGILCATAARLHHWQGSRPASLVPLERWFDDLTGAEQCGQLRDCAEVAKRLLSQQRDRVALHGDLHHANVLEFGPQNWLAIDPKGLWGDRAFDYGVLFGNPDLADPSRPIASAAFERRFAQTCQAAALEPARLRDWIIAWAGLAASWFMQDGSPLAALPLEIAERARALPLS